MQKKETAIEVKVGALVLIALAMLAVFVFVIGDFKLGGGGVRLYVDYESAAGLKPGAPVRLSGIQIGSVKSVEFMGGMEDPELQRPVYVRATIDVERGRLESIREDADFLIATQGILGESYIEIYSPVSAAPPVEPDDIIVGVDPPSLARVLQTVSNTLNEVDLLVQRLNMREGAGTPIRIDDFINNIADLTGNLNERIEENAEEIDAIFEDVSGILRENRGSIQRTIENAEGTLGEFEQLGASLNHGLGRGRELRSIMTNLDTVVDTAAREIDPILVSARNTLQQTDQILAENRQDIRTIVDNFSTVSTDVESVVGAIERGEGNLGRLLQDEEIFEDAREFIRELKRRPWRIIWKE